MRLFFGIFLLFIASFASANEENDDSEVVKKVNFVAPEVPLETYLAQFFQSPTDLLDEWISSVATKEGVDEALRKYDGIWKVEVPSTSAIEQDYGLVMKSKAKHFAISSKLRRPFTFEDKELVVQYEVKFQEGMECGGAYVKLLSDSKDLKLNQVTDKTPYTIMFGPDKCGQESKVHFIFRHENPKTKTVEEKHAKHITENIDRYFNDHKTHLYTLVVRADNTFEMYIDQVLVNSGDLLSDFKPPVVPEKEIDDPNDKKPEDWDDREKIQDKTAVKPDDWNEDEPEKITDMNAVKPAGWLDDEQPMIPDLSAEMPKDWDPKMDGDWEPPMIENELCKNAPGCGEWKRPMIPNPKYKGKWSPPMIKNPDFKGIWKPKKVPNPAYFENPQPYKMQPFSALSLELWSMSADVVFDNFLIVNSKKKADDFAASTWIIKRDAERIADPQAQSVVDAVREAINEQPQTVAAVCAAIILPLLLLLYYMCRSPRSGRQSTDVPRGSGQYSSVKKTDTPTADDEEDEDEEGEENSDDSVGKNGNVNRGSETEQEDVGSASGSRPSSRVASAKASPKGSPKMSNINKSSPDADINADSEGDANGEQVSNKKNKNVRQRRSRKE